MYFRHNALTTADDMRETEHEGNVDALVWKSGIGCIAQHGYDIFDSFLLDLPAHPCYRIGIDIYRIDDAFLTHNVRRRNGKETGPAPDLQDFLPLFEAGLEKGQKVLEVGCGPGFFTIPAAHIVGEEGIVYAVDVNPYAIARVRGKIEKEGIKNVVPMLRNASDTGLPNQGVDVAFMFGLPHIVGGREGVVSEIHRILKPGGLLSLQNARGRRGTIIDELGRIGFVLLERKASFSLFIKKR